MYHFFFIHSSIDGHLGCFNVLAIANSVVMNIEVHVSFQIMVFSKYISRSRIDESYVSSIFRFFRNLHTHHSDCSVHFSHSVLSDSATPRTAACQASLSITTSQSFLKLRSIKSCHPTISSFVITFSSCLQSLPASGFFQISEFFPSGNQSIGASASASVLPMNIQD